MDNQEDNKNNQKRKVFLTIGAILIIAGVVCFFSAMIIGPLSAFSSGGRIIFILPPIGIFVIFIGFTLIIIANVKWTTKSSPVSAVKNVFESITSFTSEANEVEYTECPYCVANVKRGEMKCGSCGASIKHK